MKLLALDLETTGLSRDNCSIIEIGAVYFDTDFSLEDLKEALPYSKALGIANRLSKICYFHEVLEVSGFWEPDALFLHKDWYPTCEKVSYDTGIEDFYDFLRDIKRCKGGRISLTGANVVAFDKSFLPYQFDEFFNTRALDVGSLYFNGTIPSMDEIVGDYLNRKKPVSHRALDDAFDVVEAVLRKCI